MPDVPWKIQRPVNGPGPLLIYTIGRRRIMFAPDDQFLPPLMRDALATFGKIYVVGDISQDEDGEQPVLAEGARLADGQTW